MAKDSSVTRASRAHRPAASKRREPRAGRLGLRAVGSAATSGPTALVSCGPQRPRRGRSSDPAGPLPTAGGILPLLRIALRPADTLDLASRPAKKSPRGSSGCPGKCSSLRRQRAPGPRPLGWARSAVAVRAARRRLVAQSMTDRPGPADQPGRKRAQRTATPSSFGRGGVAAGRGEPDETLKIILVQPLALPRRKRWF